VVRGLAVGVEADDAKGDSRRGGRPMKFVSLFAGAGLMDLGFELAGWECVKAVEWDKRAVQTWQHNRPDHADRILCADICKVTAETLELEPGELDLIIGGPPCQGFSVANSTRAHKNGNTSAWRDDPKNLLYLEFLRLVKELRPRRFIMENVKPMFSTGAREAGQPGPIMQAVLADFTEAGYRCAVEVLDTADYGVPQHRERVFVIGVRADLVEPIRYPIQTHGRAGSGYLPWMTVRDAIGDLPEPGAATANHENTASGSEVYDSFNCANLVADADKPGPTIQGNTVTGQPFHPGPMNHDTYAPVASNQGMESAFRPLDVDEPAPTVNAHHTNQPIHPGPMNHQPALPPPPSAFTEVFQKKHAPMDLDEPADTIVAKQDAGNVNLLQGPQPRRLTPRECARLQSVPDWYFFCGSKSATYRQIGNGVPVEMARRLGAVLIGAEPGREITPHQPQLTLF